MSDRESDSELLARIRSGDKAACAECIDRHGPGLYRLALRLMGNEEDAEDVVQETFFNAFKAIDSFAGRSALSTWLYRIAYNAAMMRLRKPDPLTVSIDDTLDPDGPAMVPTQLFDWCCLPDRDFDSAEVRGYLQESVDHLPQTLQTVFLLREMEGMTTRETAAVLEISEDAVKKRLHRARLWLRERLTHYFSAQEDVQDRLVRGQ